VHRDATVFSEGDRLFDLTALEILLAQALHPVGADWTVCAKRARARGVLRSEPEIACGDSR
jgi:hypothetical protein